MKCRNLCFISLVVIVSSCYKKPEQHSEIPVTKTVQFQIGKVNNYSEPIFNDLKVELKLSVAKESSLDGKVLAAWDTTFTLRSIHDYPAISTPIVITRQINDLRQSNQVIRVSRVIKYVNSANQISQNAFGEVMPVSIFQKQVSVNL
jgi:hypothetical protein